MLVFIGFLGHHICTLLPNSLYKQAHSNAGLVKLKN